MNLLSLVFPLKSVWYLYIICYCMFISAIRYIIKLCALQKRNSFKFWELEKNKSITVTDTQVTSSKIHKWVTVHKVSFYKVPRDVSPEREVLPLSTPPPSTWHWRGREEVHASSRMAAAAPSPHPKHYAKVSLTLPPSSLRVADSLSIPHHRPAQFPYQS